MFQNGVQLLESQTDRDIIMPSLRDQNMICTTTSCKIGAINGKSRIVPSRSIPFSRRRYIELKLTQYARPIQSLALGMDNLDPSKLKSKPMLIIIGSPKNLMT